MTKLQVLVNAAPETPPTNCPRCVPGNYIFQPDGNKTYRFTEKPEITQISGQVVQEIRQVFVESSIEQVYRLYADSDVLELEYRVGPIDISDSIGKEVISRFDTDLESGDRWMSDANGLYLVERQLNTRAPLWPSGPEYFNQTDQVAGNYFAANTQVYSPSFRSQHTHALL